MPKPDSCKDCTLYEMPWCGAEGNPQSAKIIYIAQNPGRTEVETGQPLSGPSGRVFNRQLFEAGLHRYELYITNQVKCLTPNNRTPTPQEVAKCKHFLDAELRVCKSDTVILAGAVAFEANIGRYSTLHPLYHPHNKRNQPIAFMERIGCVEQKDGRKWIGTIHPAFIMRMPMFRDAPIVHLRKALMIAGEEVPLPRVYSPSFAQIREMKEMAKDTGRFADDCETSMSFQEDEDDYIGGDYKLDIVGFSVNPYEAFILRPKEVEMWAEIFNDPTITQLEHNGEYDRYYLEQICPQNNFRVDTMLGHHYLHNNMRKALKPYVVSMYTNLPYYGRDLAEVDPDLYCGMDNIATLLAGLEITRQLKHEGLWDLFINHGMRLLPVLEDWRRKGLRVDLQRALLYQRVTKLKVAKAEELITKMLGPFFNWQSPKQKAELWYDTWKLPKMYNTDKETREQKITTDDDARVKLRKWINATSERKVQFKQARIFFDLIDFASENKKLSEYFDRIAPDGRIHPNFNQHAETFRLKSRPNIQNWPTWPMETKDDPDNPERKIVVLPNTRSIVVPDHDEDLLISVDFSQMQLWIYAAQFNIKNLLKIYESGEYLYGVVYEQVWKKPFFKQGVPRDKKGKGEWITDPELLRAKAVPLGFLFDRSGESVAAEVGWTSAEGAKLKKDWYNFIPELPAAHANIKYEMQQKGRLRPPPGMLLHYPTPSLQGLNCYAQTPESYIVHGSVLMIEEEIKRRGYTNTRTMLTVHDSILANVGGARVFPERMVEFYEEVMSPILTRPIDFLKGFRFKHEAKVGVMWDWEMSDYNKWKEKNYNDPSTRKPSITDQRTIQPTC